MQKEIRKDNVLNNLRRYIAVYETTDSRFAWNVSIDGAIENPRRPSSGIQDDELAAIHASLEFIRAEHPRLLLEATKLAIEDERRRALNPRR